MGASHHWCIGMGRGIGGEWQWQMAGKAYSSKGEYDSEMERREGREGRREGITHGQLKMLVLGL
jgi:hypothetical protein